MMPAKTPPRLDAATLEGCRRGDEASRDRFVDVYQERLWTFGRWNGVPRTILPDLIQDTFEAAFKEFRRFGEEAFNRADGEEHGSIYAWLTTTLRRFWISRLRRDSRWNRAQSVLMFQGRAGSVDGASYEQLALRNAVEQLNGMDREVVSMRVEDYSYAEIAQALGLTSAKAASERFYRATRLLVRLLQPAHVGKLR